MSKFAILIDAGFAKPKLGTAKNPATAQHFQDLVEKIRAHEFFIEKSLYRVYFYDAPPFAKRKPRPLGGGQHDFGADPLTIHNFKLHKELKRIDYFALRMGEVRFRGWELDTKRLPNEEVEHRVVSDDFRPSLQQKGVDMRIGLDRVFNNIGRPVTQFRHHLTDFQRFYSPEIEHRIIRRFPAEIVLPP